jgi:predicted SprT family Zn-dependent metalloprotease
MDESYKAIAQDELNRCLAIARDRYGFDITPVVRWNLRGLTGGKAMHADLSIRLNADIASAEGEAYAQTVAHELAHVVVLWRWQRAVARVQAEQTATSLNLRLPKRPRSHGLEWSSVMASFGRRANRCHNYQSATRAVERRTYAYRCACAGSAGDHLVSIIRHRKMVSGKSVYRCKRCRARITPADGSGPVIAVASVPLRAGGVLPSEGGVSP